MTRTNPFHLLNLLLISGASLGVLFGGLEDLPEKASTDRSEYRKLVLENGLRVILLSDPDLNVSAASISVDVGALKDPRERPGLAHFLEHMLFLGTEKFPDEGAYGNYIRANGGRTNAYTAGDHTNYHFEIANHAFEGALDRFSQFFIAPLFKDAFTQREMNAVDSEFERNLQNDFRRIYEILGLFYNPEHPETKFSSGNLQTLEGIEREEFISFYEAYYTASQMALALSGPASLDQLEAWAREYFSAIPTNGRDRLTYRDDLILSSDALRLIRVKPIQDLRELQIVFGVEATRGAWAGKTQRILGHLIGFEGEGSLLSYLKEKGWATTLGSGFWENTADYSQVLVTIGLTPEGQEHSLEVLESFFAFLEMLRNEPYPENVFEELATMARLDELYSDKGEGMGRTRALANRALQYPLEQAERIPYLFVEPDPETYFSILETMTPENALTLLVSRDVETDAVEPIYESEYGFERIEGEAFTALQNPEPIPALHLPPPNPYVPERLDLLETQPVALLQEPGLMAYYLQDTTFERPRNAYLFRMRPASTLVDEAKEAVLLDLYLEVIRERTNEEIYTAGVGGASASISGSLEGVRFTVSGYNGSAERLLEYVAEELKTVELPAVQFEAIKERYLRGLRNFSLEQAYTQARDLQREVAYNRHFSPAEKLPPAEGATLESVQRYARSLFRRGNLEAVVHGNLTEAQAREGVRAVQDALGLKPLPGGKVFHYAFEAPEPGTHGEVVEELSVNNSCYWQEFVLGADTGENRAMAMVLNNFMSEPYFSEMRTRQQLGYIVWSFTTRRFAELVGGFVIQSADYPAHELKARSMQLAQTFPERIRSMPEEAFERLKAGVRAELEEKDKSIRERAGTFFNLAFEHEADWDRKAETLEALKGLTRESTAQLLERALSPESGRGFTVLTYAEQHEPEA